MAVTVPSLDGSASPRAGGASWGLALLLARRQVAHRPWRSLLLLAGYGLGVAVMIVLLSVGEAMVSQASEEKLVGGGDVTVLPEGIDIEVMKTGGLGGLFFSIANARFVALQLLASPRLGDAVAAVAPQVDNKLLYLGTADGRELPVKATGEIPSASGAVGAVPVIAEGVWADDADDARWLSPTTAELVHDIDHFHLPPAGIAQRESWGEWHYFNVLTPDRRRWAFLSLMVGGAIPDGEWGGQLLVTLHEVGRPARRFSARVPREAVRFSTTDANLRVGSGTVRVDSAGRYAVQLTAREEGTAAPLTVALTVTPTPRAYFPGASLGSGDFASGYAVPGLRADATGSICAPGWCERFEGAQGYHDHNWGTWRGVTWEWGAARLGPYALLYGRVQPPDSLATEAPLFLYVVDSLGFRGLFRPRRIDYTDGRAVAVSGGRLAVPSRAVLRDVRGGDTVEVVLDIDDATASDTRQGYIDRGEANQARVLRRPWFVQLAGRARLRGVIDGQRVEGSGAGFFETYR
jgi:hypothetical protein